MADNNDIQITNNHLYLENGDLVLVQDLNRIKQQILTGLKILFPIGINVKGDDV